MFGVCFKRENRSSAFKKAITSLIKTEYRLCISEANDSVTDLYCAYVISAEVKSIELSSAAGDHMLSSSFVLVPNRQGQFFPSKKSCILMLHESQQWYRIYGTLLGPKDRVSRVSCVSAVISSIDSECNRLKL